MKIFKYLLLSFVIFTYSLAVFSRTVVISDIDDTLKKSNSVGKPLEQVYHFLQKKPYVIMIDLFSELKSDARKRFDDINFYYVSAAYSATFKADKWIDKHNFPQGRTVLRSLKEKISIRDFKYNTIMKILEQEIKNLDSENGEELIVYFFGDNAQYDPQIYLDVSRNLGLIAPRIFIRDVRVEATEFDATLPISKIPGVNYFFSEKEFLMFPEFEFMSSTLKNKINEMYSQQEIIPKYTLKTFERRLKLLLDDRRNAKKMAYDLWLDYHQRY